MAWSISSRPGLLECFACLFFTEQRFTGFITAFGKTPHAKRGDEIQSHMLGIPRAMRGWITLVVWVDLARCAPEKVQGFRTVRLGVVTPASTPGLQRQRNRRGVLSVRGTGWAFRWYSVCLEGRAPWCPYASLWSISSYALGSAGLPSRTATFCEKRRKKYD
eukprot:1176952-Prorocentrum_minimum.AAC.1